VCKEREREGVCACVRAYMECVILELFVILEFV